MKQITLITLCVFIAVLSAQGQLNMKKLKDKAQSSVSSPATKSSTSSSSENSVFKVKKVDMEALEEKPAGTVKGLSKFYGAGYEIMKNTIGLVLSSADGVNWNQEFVANETELVSVAYGEGKIVAVGGDKVFYTADGKTWNKVESATNAPLNGGYCAVTYGGGMFVAVGTTATLTFSKDGETWVRYFGEELDPDYDAGKTHFYGVSFVNGKFYVVGNSNRIISLIPDVKEGLKKEKCTVLGQVTNRLNEVTFGNNTYLAVGAKDDYISTDGQNWTPTKPEWQIWGASYANGLFVKACGFGRVFTSPTAQNNTWEEVYYAQRTMFWDACYGNNMWIVTGKDGNSLTSADGKEWENHTIKPSYTIKSLIFIE